LFAKVLFKGRARRDKNVSKQEMIEIGKRYKEKILKKNFYYIVGELDLENMKT
jgi:hypothetical protein